MSWYTDPEMFIYWGPPNNYGIYRITKKYNAHLVAEDFINVGELDFSVHLSLGNNVNKESDYDALKSILARNSRIGNREKVMMVNCQGWVVFWDYLKETATWSRIDEHESIFYSLPGIIINPYVTVLAKKLEAVEKLNSEFLAEISSLKDKLNQEKSDREALQKSRGGSADAEPWMSGSTVPSNWVPFDQLVVQNIPMDTTLKITAAPGASEFVEDTTTNVHANRFRQGIFPIVVVKVAELNPNNGKARFNPDVWCSINSAGNSYAARKPLESEMSFEPHMG